MEQFLDSPVPWAAIGAVCLGFIAWCFLSEPLQYAKTGALVVPMILAPVVSGCEQAAKPLVHELFFEETMLSAERFMSTSRADIHGRLYCAPTGKYVGNCSVKHSDGSRTVLECDAESCKIVGQFR